MATPPSRTLRGSTALAVAVVTAAAGALPAPSAAQDASAAPPVASPTHCYPAGPGRLACYDKPGLFGFLLNVPGDLGSLFVDAFRRDNLPALAGVAGSMAVLIAVDQPLVNGARRAGKATNVAADDDTRKAPVLSLPYPADVGAGLYYIGDGMVPVTIALGMLGYGFAASDARALQTTSQLAEGMLSVGILVQTVKHTAGRETPNRATQSSGTWRPVPNIRDYHKNVPAFDAFPSGHMATAMMTVTVLSENYPEYWLIRPVGYGLMTLLGVQMMNNGVHWASDYPLAIAVGYGLGKRAVANGRTIVRAGGPHDGSDGDEPERGITFLPVPGPGGGGLSLSGRF